MAFVTNNIQQMALTDSIFHLTEREQKFLEQSWAKVFADRVFPAIDEEIFSVFYSDKICCNKFYQQETSRYLG